MAKNLISHSKDDIFLKFVYHYHSFLKACYLRSECFSRVNKKACWKFCGLNSEIMQLLSLFYFYLLVTVLTKNYTVLFFF